MALSFGSRDAAEIILGARLWFIPDGTPYGNSNQVSSADNIPTLEEAKATGRYAGGVQTFKWGLEYKQLEITRFSRTLNRYVKQKKRVLQEVKPTFTTPDVLPETFALMFGMSSLPQQGQSATAFDMASGYLKGTLYMELRDGYHSFADDSALAEVHLYGELGLSDSPEYNEDMLKVSYEFNVTKFPEECFRNIGIPTELNN